MYKKLHYCEYDNPATFCREIYFNKKLQSAYSLRYLYSTKCRNRVVGAPWNTNSLTGSYKALPDKYLRIYMEY